MGDVERETDTSYLEKHDDLVRMIKNNKSGLAGLEHVIWALDLALVGLEQIRDDERPAAFAKLVSYQDLVALFRFLKPSAETPG